MVKDFLHRYCTIQYHILSNNINMCVSFKNILNFIYKTVFVMISNNKIKTVKSSIYIDYCLVLGILNYDKIIKRN
jgi:hypothetical protein